ncbi:hypothetical protein FFF34_009975 [Inquilinus sp. KBS0705]|nr:hypothetical protein FFF34_009975 [Inquilinus sp. KBS0705]
MIKLLFKTTFFTLLLTSFALISKAQIGYDYAQYDIGFGANANKVYGDAETVKTTPSVYVNFNFNQTPFVNYIAEVQKGTLEGGSLESQSGRYFKNSYTALVFRGQLQFGEFLNYSRSGVMNVLKNVYLSSGFGYVVNDMTSINRKSKILQNYTTPGEDKSNELFIPARIGYEIKVYNKYDQPSFKIDIAYQHNFDLTDNLDGFNTGKDNDRFSQISIGFKVALGGVTSYRKSLHN